MFFIKILYITISFNKNASNLYNNLVSEIVSRGHQLTIVRRSEELLEDSFGNRDNRIISVSSRKFFKKNFVLKGIDSLLIGFSFKRTIKKNLKNDNYDLILYATPPITFNSVVRYCKRKYKAKTFLMLKDIFPQNAVDLQMIKKGGIIYNLFRHKEKSLYLISDYIGCMSKGNIDYVLNNNNYIDSDKLLLFPNSITINNDSVDSKKNQKKETTFIFGGNLGKPQNINGLIKVIDDLKNFDNARFIICGDGTEKKIIEDYVAKKNSSKFLEFYCSMPFAEYNRILNDSDVGIISLDPRFTIPNIPSKLQNYMLLKKPVLAIIDSVTDLDEIIENSNCGWYIYSSNISSAKDIIVSICNKKVEQIKKGKSGFEYLRGNYDIKKNVDILEEIIKEKV